MALAHRNMGISMAPWEAADRKQREIKGKLEGLQHERNQASAQIARLKKAGESVETPLIRMKQVGCEIGQWEAEMKAVQQEIAFFSYRLPNLPHASVPIGKDARDNVTVRTWGTPPVFPFTPKPHWEIGEVLGVLDFERGAKIAGARFALYRGLGAALERALIQFMLDLHVRAHGYLEILPPLMANRDSLLTTAQLPKFEEDLFALGDPDYFMIPTAEVPLTNIHRGEILAEAQLPLSYVAHTPCFRREAGSYGKDTRGLIRQHQFNKVELVWFSTPETSYATLERLVGHAEAVLVQLGLPYRVVALCTGDLGFAAAKTYDLEVWLPSQETYREISSCSNFEDFQARRGTIRYRASGGAVRHLHTLNGSALAVGRTVAAILENNQQADGSVTIPGALRPYMGDIERIGPPV